MPQRDGVGGGVEADLVRAGHLAGAVRRDVDLALMSYDERLRSSMDPTRGRNSRESRDRVPQDGCRGGKERRFRAIEKAIDVRA